MGKVHLEEFLYRGRPDGDPQAPAWHIVLMENIGTSAINGQPKYETHTLNMGQAEAAGYTLPKLIAGINVDLMKTNEALSQRLAATENDEPAPLPPAPPAKSSPWPWFYGMCIGAAPGVIVAILHFSGVLS